MQYVSNLVLVLRMLRFPNPNSDIVSFIRVFQTIYRDLQDTIPFTFDDMSDSLVRNNLATSCGRIGNDALIRSTREDRSRDPLFNQSKMFSELYRTLGWVFPAVDKRSSFTFTFLGAHVAEAHLDPTPLVKECIMGITYPSYVLEIKDPVQMRPFSYILKTMAQLEGVLSRAEMIIGPLSIKDDRSQEEFERMISKIMDIRGSNDKLAASISELCIANKVKYNTMGNYIRFPVSVLKWSGWASEERISEIYSSPYKFYRLTEDGNGQLERIAASQDIRVSDLEGLEDNILATIARLCTYKMLERGGFDIAPVLEIIDADKEEYRAGHNRIIEDIDSCIFSPFQEFPPAFLETVFPLKKSTELQNEHLSSAVLKEHDENEERQQVFSIILLEKATTNADKIDKDQEIISLLDKGYKAADGISNKAAELLFPEFEKQNQDQFYPLVSGLLRICGCNCELSRIGVNYERWDALIKHPEQSIPIEIKSPGEELSLSAKAIRQALENKIVLLARKQYPTEKETSTLAVGYNLPNNRAEAEALVYDIFKAFEIRIGIMGLLTLLEMAIQSLFEDKQLDYLSLAGAHGIIGTEDT